MILRYMTLEDFNIFGFAYLSDQFPQPDSDFAFQYWLAVFGDPNQMVFQIVNGMA